MDKRNWYTGQLVTESQMDEAFDDVETSIRACFADAGISGITTGLGVTPGGGTKQVVLGSGVAYDTFGRRIALAEGQTLTLTVDSAGSPITNPSGSNVRWVSVFVKFELDETEPAVDGGGTSILTRSNESFLVVIKQAAEGPAVSAARASAEADEIRCADVKLVLGTTTFISGDIDLTTADVAFAATALDDSKVGGKTLDAALTAIYQGLEERIADVEGAIGDPLLLGPPTEGFICPRRDSDISTDRDVSFTNLDAYLRVLEVVPVRHRKLTDAILDAVPGASSTAPVLTANEFRTQLPIWEVQPVTSNIPTEYIPCLMFKFPIGDSRYWRIYSYYYGFIFTYNCHITSPDGVISWTRDVNAGAAYSTSSWAIVSGSLDPLGASNVLTKYSQDHTQPNTWDYTTGWQDISPIEP